MQATTQSQKMPATLTEKPLNVRLPIEVASQLERLTKATGRTKSFLTVEALRDYLEVQEWQIKDVQEAISEADRGEFAPEDEVKAIFAKYGS
jgi:RHH-type transcriptional regulator, rel operon repressor / antitoxin RelB